MIKELLYEAGAVLKKESYELKGSSLKEKFDLITTSDIKIEDILVKSLINEYPEYSIFSEEKGEISSSGEKRWIIDPIDGTANFVFGVPYFSISLSLEINGVISEGHV